MLDLHIHPVENYAERSPGGDPFADARCSQNGEEFLIESAGIARFRFRSASSGIQATPFAGAMPAAVREAYRRLALPLAAQALGWEVLHASAVEAGGGILAFCGPPRAGKSTLAHALSRRGCPPWADDALVFDVREDSVASPSIPFALRLRDDARRFFRLTDCLEEGTAHAATLAVARIHILQEAPPGKAPAACRLAPPEAFRALLTHAYCFDAADRPRMARMLDAYFDLVERVPVYALRFAHDFARLDDLLDLVRALP